MTELSRSIIPVEIPELLALPRPHASKLATAKESVLAETAEVHIAHGSLFSIAKMKSFASPLNIHVPIAEITRAKWSRPLVSHVHDIRSIFLSATALNDGRDSRQRSSLAARARLFSVAHGHAEIMGDHVGNAPEGPNPVNNARRGPSIPDLRPGI